MLNILLSQGSKAMISLLLALTMMFNGAIGLTDYLQIEDKEIQKDIQDLLKDFKEFAEDNKKDNLEKVISNYVNTRDFQDELEIKDKSYDYMDKIVSDKNPDWNTDEEYDALEHEPWHEVQEGIIEEFLKVMMMP